MMSNQELVITQEKKNYKTDVECPDCQSMLTIFYDDDENGRIIYECENCDQQVSARDLDDDAADNNINIEYSGSFNIGIFQA